MPNLPKPHVIAIFCADLHLCITPPPCRRGEKNWLKTQAGYLSQVQDLQEKHNARVYCAGDIFDRWDSPVELVNMAMAHAPSMIAVPGQHDLSLHNLDDIKKTAYWTLAQSGVVQHLGPGAIMKERSQTISVYGFPWGCQITSCVDTPPGWKIALVHQYAWMEGKTYPNAPVSGNIKTLLRQLRGYDVAVFGDNHIPWESLSSVIGPQCQIFNCGGFMRRRSDEIDHKPSVGLLYSDGYIDRHYLDISKDVFEVMEEKPEAPIETNQLRSFMRKLKQLSGKGTKSEIDFLDSLRFWASQNPGPTAHLLLETLDEIEA